MVIRSMWHHPSMAGAERQPGGLGFALRDPYPWVDLTTLVRRAEAVGYRAVFLPEVGARDTLATLVGLAGETRTLLLGTGVVPLPSRSANLLAMAASTVQERSGGRLILGLGTGPAIPGALDRLRDTVLALRAAFAGGTGEVDGRGVRTVLTPATPPPIWIAALGPRATRLGGQVADGVLLNWCTPERVARARQEVQGAAAATGRDPSTVTIAVYIRAALTPGSDVAAREAASEYASYPAYARQFEAMGLDPADPDEVVHGVMITGASMAAERLEAYRAAGAELPIVYPIVPMGHPSAAAAAETLEACI
jgi:alkanesulfonate monooxygenase SsuD/methylene tetrahydromethanopterin reductase-like flavin-dependent oxidoreductase (luciferase family)